MYFSANYGNFAQGYGFFHFDLSHEGYTMGFSARQYAEPVQSLLESEVTVVIIHGNFAQGYGFFPFDLKNYDLQKANESFKLSKVNEVSIRETDWKNGTFQGLEQIKRALSD